MFCVQEIFNLKCLLIEFVIPNLSQIYFSIQEIFKTNVSTHFFSTKSALEFVLTRCEFTKVILQSRSWCEMFVLKLSGKYQRCFVQFQHYWQLDISGCLVGRQCTLCPLLVLLCSRSLLDSSITSTLGQGKQFMVDLA